MRELICERIKNLSKYKDQIKLISIEKALNEKSDNQLKNYIENNFLWQKVAELTANIYKQVLEN